MGQFFREGGVGMFPTALFGFLFLASTLLSALRPDRKLGPLAVALGAATFGTGLLGFGMGLSATFSYLQRVAPDKQLLVAAAGAAESLNNLILAALLLIPGSLTSAVGAFRASRRAPGT